MIILTLKSVAIGKFVSIVKSNYKTPFASFAVKGAPFDYQTCVIEVDENGFGIIVTFDDIELAAYGVVADALENIAIENPSIKLSAF